MELNVSNLPWWMTPLHVSKSEQDLSGDAAYEAIIDGSYRTDMVIDRLLGL
jgi:hypothetical protein